MTSAQLYATHISVFASVQSTEPINTTLGQWLTSTKNRNQILRLRSTTDEAVKKMLKKKLPAATISGVFKKRNTAGLIKYNGLICLDFDHAQNTDFTPDDMKALLGGFPETAYCAVSVGGRGVFMIVQTDLDSPQSHATIIDLLGQTIFKQTGLRYDPACKDVCRMRTISYDPDAWAPPEFDIFQAKKIIQARYAAPPRPFVVRQPVQPHSNEDLATRVEERVVLVERKGIDVVPQYDDWVRVGMALASAFGMSGESWFHRISQFHPEYSHEKTAQKYKNCAQTGKRISIGTFFKLVKV